MNTKPYILGILAAEAGKDMIPLYDPNLVELIEPKNIKVPIFRVREIMNQWVNGYLSVNN